MPDKNRRPYLNLDDYESRKPGVIQSALETSLVRMSSRYLRAALERESEFEKPYLGGSPRKMHLDPSTPDWPDISPIPNYDKPFEPVEGTGPGCSHCVLTFDPIWNCDTDWAELHAMVWCSWEPGSGDCPDCKMSVRAIVGQILEVEWGSWGGNFANMSDFTASGDCKIKITDPVTGQIRWIEVDCMGPFGPGTTVQQSIAPLNTMSLRVKVNSAITNHVLQGEMIDGAGNYCQTYLTVNCACDCDSATTFAIDTANSDTVTSSKSATVVVTGGCGPYVWSIAGTGWSINPSGSSDLMSATITVNTSTCNKTTSVAKAVVSIVDNCGTTTTHTINHEGGQWEWIASYGTGCADTLCQSYGPCGCTACHSATDIYHNGVGAGGAYNAKWTNITYWDGCKGTCDLGCEDSKQLGTGSDCGSDTLYKSEASVPDCPSGCWNAAHLYYWTCGADCS